MTSSVILNNITAFIDELDDYGLLECSDIQEYLKACVAGLNDFGDVTRTIFVDILLDSGLTCPIAVAKRYVEHINVSNYYEPDCFHSLV